MTAMTRAAIAMVRVFIAPPGRLVPDPCSSSTRWPPFLWHDARQTRRSSACTATTSTSSSRSRLRARRCRARRRTVQRSLGRAKATTTRAAYARAGRPPRPHREARGRSCPRPGPHEVPAAQPCSCWTTGRPIGRASILTCATPRSAMTSSPPSAPLGRRRSRQAHHPPRLRLPRRTRSRRPGNALLRLSGPRLPHERPLQDPHSCRESPRSEDSKSASEPRMRSSPRCAAPAPTPTSACPRAPARDTPPRSCLPDHGWKRARTDDGAAVAGTPGQIPWPSPGNFSSPNRAGS